MLTAAFEDSELEEAWVEGSPGDRWRSASGTAGPGTGTSLLEVDPGHRLPPHVDSAEEVIVVVSGAADVEIAGRRATVEAGGTAIVPACEKHFVACAGDQPLRFVAVYASDEVTTTYDEPIQPGGERERQPVG